MLAEATIGRVVLTVDVLATALPVSYLLDGDDVVFRTETGTLSAAGNGTVVAFQVDCFPPLARVGWKVVVTGLAMVVSEPADIRHLQSVAIPVMGAPSSTDYIRLSTALIRGQSMGSQHEHHEAATI